jgi:hypothetical protein
MMKGASSYWWRAVSITYLLRPNAPTLALLKNLTSQLALPLGSDIPTQMQCISVYVRHGDKGQEMKLLDFPTYKEAALLLWERHLVPANNASYFHRYVHAHSRHHSGGGGSGEREKGAPGRNNSTSHHRNSSALLFVTTEDPSIIEVPLPSPPLTSPLII